MRVLIVCGELLHVADNEDDSILNFRAFQHYATPIEPTTGMMPYVEEWQRLRAKHGWFPRVDMRAHLIMEGEYGLLGIDPPAEAGDDRCFSFAIS